MKTIKLTQKTARELARKVLGVSGQKLEKLKTPKDVDMYKMQMGELEVIIENDWYKKNGRYKVDISTPSAGCLWLYYYPETLEEDWEENEKALKELRKDD